MTGVEIPIWVAGKQLLMSGVDRKTTVGDVVETLLGHPDKQYSLIEKWRRVERPLNGGTRILKLWKTWGEANTEVKLSLKKVLPVENDSGESSPISITSRRCGNKHRHKSACSKYTGHTMHPRRLAQLSKTQNIERLLKLLLLQGETIQNQILKLKERENEIEHLEGEQHENRVNILGSNYLLETYMRNVEEKEDSGVATEQPSSENTSTPTGDDCKDEEISIKEDSESELRDLQDRVQLLEKVSKINKRLETEEENLVRLFINIERCKKNDTNISDLQSNLKRLREQNEKSENEMNNYSKKLSDIEVALSGRKCYLRQLLQHDIDDGIDLDDGRGVTNSEQLRPSNIPVANVCNAVAVENDYYSLPCRHKPILNTLV